MSKVKFNAFWYKELKSAFNVPKGYVLLRCDDFYTQNVEKFFTKLDSYQKKKFVEAYKKTKRKEDLNKSLRPLEVSIEFHYFKRSIIQNALLWALYEIEANEQNGGMQGAKEQMITPMELYETDLREYGEREMIRTLRKNLESYTTKYRIIESVLFQGLKFTLQDFLKHPCKPDDYISVFYIKSSSNFDTKEMAIWIDRIFNRIAYHGVNVTEPGQIEKYWKDWRQSLNDNKILIHDAIMSQAEYKALNPICEACGKFIQKGTGELSHIQAIGMGGDRKKELSKNYTSNWLHLHFDCHRIDWHQLGIKKFLSKYSHLRYKVNSALRRSYKPIN